MGDFIKTYLAILIALGGFLWFGGYILVTNPLLAVATAAFLLTVAVRTWLSLEDRLENLKKQIEQLEEKLRDKENRT